VEFIRIFLASWLQLLPIPGPHLNRCREKRQKPPTYLLPHPLLPPATISGEKKLTIATLLGLDHKGVEMNASLGLEIGGVFGRLSHVPGQLDVHLRHAGDSQLLHPSHQPNDCEKILVLKLLHIVSDGRMSVKPRNICERSALHLILGKSGHDLPLTEPFSSARQLFAVPRPRQGKLPQILLSNAMKKGSSNLLHSRKDRPLFRRHIDLLPLTS
jgi:hypothetical protein